MTSSLLAALAVIRFLVPADAGYHRLAARQIARHYGADPDLVECICQAESEWNPNAHRKNDWGDSDAVGLAQFHLASWEHLRCKMGLPETDLRHVPEQALATLAFGLANGYGKWWSAFEQCECTKEKQHDRGGR